MEPRTALLQTAILLLATTASGQQGVRSFDRGCGPVATWPRLTVTQGAPRLNTRCTVTGSLLAPNSVALTAIGTSNTGWHGIRLPLLLDPRPFPPCQLLVGPDLLLSGRTDANGRQSLQLTIPNDNRLLGLKVYLQMATHTALLAMTEGLELTVH